MAVRPGALVKDTHPLQADNHSVNMFVAKALTWSWVGVVGHKV